MKLSDFFIDRPIFAAVLSAFITIGGAIALLKLPISEYPEVVPPSVVVRATYPGANPKVVADTVAAPLEPGPGRDECGIQATGCPKTHIHPFPTPGPHAHLDE